MIETSKECAGLLKEFLDRLEDIQERVKSVGDGGSYGCFPFYYDESNNTCATSNSPICRMCRGLHEYKLVAEWREDQ